MPARVSSSSIGGSCALIRTRTAISDVVTPAAISRRMPATRAAISTFGSGKSVDRGLGAGWSGGREGAARSAGRQSVGQLEDLRGRSVVLGQRDRLGARVLVGKTEQVVGRGAGEGVDRLVGIADDREVARLADPQLEQALLERVRVLVLVDADPRLLALDEARGLLVRLEQLDGQREHVLEVDPPGAVLARS